jgi:hypothetical protein
MHKLGIIVPYRDRAKQLRVFIRELKKFLNVYPRVDYTVIVVNQEDIKKFNRAKLLNIGFIEAVKRGCDYVIFHDVDLIPIKGHYQYSDKPLQLANDFEATDTFRRTIQRDYFGGVTLFPVEAFQEINGYSNKYRGWGFEDNDLLFRCREKNLPLEDVHYRTPTYSKPALFFNGKSSFVKIPNSYTFVRPISFVTSFYPSEIICDPDEITDEYAIFGIPGYDLNLSFNSFSTYKFELFLVNDVTLSLTTPFTPNVPVRTVVTVDPKERRIEFYFNGKKIAYKEWDQYHIRKYNAEPFLYLGAADPLRKNKPKFYKGHIDSFSVFNKVLSRDEIKHISNNYHDDILTDLPGREYLKENLITSYDSRYLSEDGERMLDISGKNKDAFLHNVEVKHLTTSPSVVEKMPLRRTCKYKLLEHKEGGYIDGYWVDWKSRENQLYYRSLVNSKKSNLENDGLSTCNYRILGIEEKNDYIKLNVRT